MEGGERLDDIVLIRQCKKGERTAFETIIKKYYLPLTGFFYKHIQDPHICEDLTHDVIVKFLENVHQYKPIKGIRFSSWLYRIAYNTYIDYLRKLPTRNEVALEHEMELCDSHNTAEEVALSIECEELEKKLHLLPSRMRTLLVLRYINGMSYEEIEKITGIEKTKIKSRIHYSLQKIKKLYEKEGGKAV